MFDGTLGDFDTPPVQIDLKEGVQPVHSRYFHVPYVHTKHLLKEIQRIVALGISKKDSD